MSDKQHSNRKNRNRKLQTLARARSAKTGESYRAALAHLANEKKSQHPEAPGAAGDLFVGFTRFGDAILTANGLYDVRTLEQKPELLTHPDDGEIAICAEWLSKFARPSKSLFRQNTSYGLKHEVERWTRDYGGERKYVSNGALISAACRAGFEFSMDSGPNVHFKLALRLPQHEWKRVRATGFSRWLFSFAEEQSPRGDLARDAKDDKKWPRRSKAFTDFWSFLSRTGARETFVDAWREFTGASPNRAMLGDHFDDEETETQLAQ